MPVAFFFGLALVNFIVQELPVEWISPAERITLVSALLVAVIVLWRSLQQKDNLSVEGTRQITLALTTAATSNAELRKIIEDSVRTKQELTEEFKLLRISMGNLPCLVADAAARKHFVA